MPKSHEKEKKESHAYQNLEGNQSKNSPIPKSSNENVKRTQKNISQSSHSKRSGSQKPPSINKRSEKIETNFTMISESTNETPDDTPAPLPNKPNENNFMEQILFETSQTKTLLKEIMSDVRIIKAVTLKQNANIVESNLTGFPICNIDDYKLMEDKLSSTQFYDEMVC